MVLLECGHGAGQLRASMSAMSPDVAAAETRQLTRRTLLWGAAGVAGVAAVGGVGLALAPAGSSASSGLGPTRTSPMLPRVRCSLEQVESAARGRPVDLFTAVPDGYGDGAGLPVVVILHGASATARDFQPFGLARFLTQAVRDGAEPFVLAGADGGTTRWEGDGRGDDPQAMLTDELPGWLAERGFDADRRALWGWSMGGYGALRLAESSPTTPRAVAAFSPAIDAGDAVSSTTRPRWPVRRSASGAEPTTPSTTRSEDFVDELTR